MGLLSVLACWASCKACNPQVTPPRFDTSPDSAGKESADSVDSRDTAPPPMCAQPEQEPNNNDTEPTFIAREREACGEISQSFDLDYYEFETRTAGWIEIDVDAAERGSAADLVFGLGSEGGHALLAGKGAQSSDPYILVPVPGADTWRLAMAEQDPGQGADEGYEYFFHVSEAKSPITPDSVEVEDHGSWDLAQPIVLGEVVYATLVEGDERDWYVLTTPDAKVQLRAEIVAHRLGSPLDTRLVMWKTTKEGDSLKSSWEEWADTNPFDVGNDPAFERTGGGGEVWYLQVLEARNGTGELYWYTITVNEVSE
ncbi:MAG TPA: hypothetical protein QGF58_11080 [Myxococcota bacterium]|nr:hypothetical protein [Myxococcota bacterium]